MLQTMHPVLDSGSDSVPILKTLSTLYLIFFYNLQKILHPQKHTTNYLDTRAHGAKNINTKIDAPATKMLYPRAPINLQLRPSLQGKNMFGDSCAQILSRAFIFSPISQEYGCFCGATSPFSQGSLCAGRECVLFVFMHMNSIR